MGCRAIIGGADTVRGAVTMDGDMPRASHKQIRITLTLALTIAASGAAAQKVYRWVDDKGVVHYGDSVPPEYAKVERDVLNDQGIAVETLEAELSAEELAARKEAERRAEEQRRVEERQARYDDILVNTYLSVQEIESLRDRRVELIGGQIRVTELYLDNLRERLAKLQKEAQRFKPYSSDPDARPIDRKLSRELADVLNAIVLYEDTLAKSKAKQQELVQKFAADISRFQELKGN